MSGGGGVSRKSVVRRNPRRNFYDLVGRASGLVLSREQETDRRLFFLHFFSSSSLCRAGK